MYETSLPAPENRRHFPGLNSLRGLLVLAVFAGHYQFVRSNFFDLAAWAVHCFFVLSGFLITGILYDTRNSKNRWKAFYARRTLRIFPLYYGCLLVVLLLEPVCRWIPHPSQWLWPLYLSNYGRLIWPQDMFSGVTDHFVTAKYHFTLYFGHFWTLCIEEQFYLVWPLIVFWIKDRRRLMIVCGVAVLVVPVIRVFFLMYVPWTKIDGFIDRVVLFQTDALLLGAFVALWSRGGHPSFYRVSLWLAGIVASLIAVDYFILVHQPWMSDPFHLLGASAVSLSRVAANLFGLACVLFAMEARGKSEIVLSNRFLYWLGTISYGFYVFHDIPHVIYTHLTKKVPIPHTISSGILGFACTMALAALSFRYFETPFLQLKNRFQANKG